MKLPIKKVIIHFFWFLFFEALIITTSIIVENNAEDPYLYTDDSFNFKFQPNINRTEYPILLDQHSHTELRGGVLTVKQNVLWHIAHGFNAMVLTDHNSLASYPDVEALSDEIKAQITIIKGMEYTTDRIHMNLIGIKEFNRTIVDEPTDEELQAVINYTHDQGGVVSVNHPRNDSVDPSVYPTYSQLRSWGVDNFELVNGNKYYNYTLPWINATGFGEISGTDMHSPKTVNAWTGINPTNNSVEAIMVELRAHRTKVFYDAVGSVDQSTTIVNPTYKWLKPLIQLGSIFKVYQIGDQLDWEGISVIGIYLLGIFIIAELFRFGNQKLWEIQAKKKVKK